MIFFTLNQLIIILLFNCHSYITLLASSIPDSYKIILMGAVSSGSKGSFKRSCEDPVGEEAISSKVQKLKNVPQQVEKNIEEEIKLDEETKVASKDEIDVWSGIVSKHLTCHSCNKLARCVPLMICPNSHVSM